MCVCARKVRPVSSLIGVLVSFHGCRTSMDEFKYCEPEFLNLTSRRHRILLEIEKFSPDIICMQVRETERETETETARQGRISEQCE